MTKKTMLSTKQRVEIGQKADNPHLALSTQQVTQDRTKPSLLVS